MQERVGWIPYRAQRWHMPVQGAARLMTEFFHYKGYDIPVPLMLMTGGGPDTFEMISCAHMQLLDRWIGISSDHQVLEIGCGIGRDAIPLSERLDTGSYVGIDIIGPSIQWCKDNIGARNPNFQFHHFNVKDQLHNQHGDTKTTDIEIPLPRESADRIILFSVFTHMFRADIEHYLREFRRVLKPDGLIYATTFIYNDEILDAAHKANRTPFNLRFEHEIDPGCRINDPAAPLGAVAYTRAAWDDMVRQCDLRYAKPFLNGGWSGFYPHPDEGQDVAILARGDV